MERFICEKCGYCTNEEHHLRDHHNSKKGCDPNKIHGKIKKTVNINDIPELKAKIEEQQSRMKKLKEKEKIDNHTCHICNRYFKRPDNLKRHYETDSHMENVKIHGNNNTITNNSNNTNVKINLAINGPVNINNPTIIHKYTHYDINDLTLFQQYLICTHNIYSDNTPYEIMMTYLNFSPDKHQYHNFKYPDIKKATVKVYEDAWFTKNISVIENIISNQHGQLCLIYNKFRIFLGRRACTYNLKYLYDGLECSNEHKSLFRKIKCHMYNNRKIQNESNEPSQQDEIIWKSLSKSFDWEEVVAYIIKMNEIGVDFNQNLKNIRQKILSYKEHKKFFKKLIKRLDILIYERDKELSPCSSFVPELDPISSSESDEMDNFDNYHKKIDDAIAIKQKREASTVLNNLLSDDVKYKNSIKKDDHKNLSRKVINGGSDMVGKSFYEGEEENLKKINKHENIKKINKQ